MTSTSTTASEKNPSPQDRLTAYVMDELDAAERDRVQAELDSRPDWQQEVRDIQELAGMLRQELAAEPVLSLTPQQRLELEQAAQSSRAIDPARRRRIRRWAIVSAEVAAAVVVAALLLNSPALSTRAPQVSSHESLSQKPTTLATSIPGESREQDYESAQLTTLGEEDEVGSKLEGRLATPARDVADGPKGLGSSSRVSDSRLSGVSSDEYNTRLSLSGQGPQQAEGRFKSRNSPVDGLVAVRVKGDHLEDKPVASREAKLHDLADSPALRESLMQSEPVDGETYERRAESLFLTPIAQPLSTFSIDVDTASYANVRRFLTQGQMPPADAVRVEELINYFAYDYPQPAQGQPFSVMANAAACPWQPGHYLARIALKARSIDKATRPPTNLVFLLDVSGSMQPSNKLPLVKQAIAMLAEELNERDRIAIVTYAGNAGVTLASTPGSDQAQIMQAIDSLSSGGSTNGAAGINLAYEQALRHFNGEGENRVILCTDGDFNVGISDDQQLIQLIQQHARSKVFLSIFGFGMGNLKDAKLEKLADKGNGHYGYIDDLREARRVFCDELSGTLYTVAKDVKIQVEFNPLTVGAYRLIGYENRALAAKDFHDDSKDAGEIGAGHTVTALYEIVPKGQWPKSKPADALKYAPAVQEPAPVEEPARRDLPPEAADDLFTVKLRYKLPQADTSVKTVDYVVDDIRDLKAAPSTDFVWAAAVASFGMQLQNSAFKGTWTLDDVLEAAQGAKGEDPHGRRREFLDLVLAAKRLTPANPPRQESPKKSVGF